MLNEILAGPILRRLTNKQLVLWWISPAICRGEFVCYLDYKPVLQVPLHSDVLSSHQIGERAFVHLLNLTIDLPCDTLIEYDLLFDNAGQSKNLAQILPHLTYGEQQRPSFVISPKINNMLHGSCRNPHNPNSDSLLAGDKLVGDTLLDVQKRPSLLMMSGDQIYSDHVAGPTLHVIHQVIELLGLNNEQLFDETLPDSETLYQQSAGYYQRSEILPTTDIGAPWYNRNARQSIFTSVHTANHLITFAETMAMYLLIWSPTLWHEVANIGFNPLDKYRAQYESELAAIEDFVQGLDKVQRLLAHIPTYMIFDDHDVTDDWNLTAQWEQAVYQNPLAKRMIGNSLIAYWLCQGWGNDPKQFGGQFKQLADNYQTIPNSQNQDAFIEYLLHFTHWQYTLETTPKLVVLDSRTRRWRSEQNINEPSGLMDWEALCELQQELIGQDSIILVSPAPIFGVKIIETIQRMATIFGKPLAVDAENWMAHPDSASTILNIFKHPKTPHHFVILSGDVHYSFVYDIELRFRHYSPKIWQITSSGIKNQFPPRLIHCLDNINRWLYGAYSPLNLFTKRRAMRIKGRNVVGQEHRRLIPRSGLGYLELANDGSPKHIYDLHNDGHRTEFIESKEELIP